VRVSGKGDRGENQRDEAAIPRGISIEGSGTGRGQVLRYPVSLWGRKDGRRKKMFKDNSLL